MDEGGKGLCECVKLNVILGISFLFFSTFFTNESMNKASVRESVANNDKEETLMFVDLIFFFKVKLKQHIFL